MTGRAGGDEQAEKVQRIRHTVEYEKRELENRPGWKCNVPSALYVEDCEWLLAELASLKDALGEYEQAAAWEQDHGGCDCRACTVLMDAALEAVARAALSSVPEAGE